MNEVFITSAVRTAVGSFNGSLANMPAHDLGKIVIKEAIARSNVEASEVEEVILGQVLTAATGQNPARQAAINAGLNKETPAWLVNQVCGSGLRSVALAYQAIMNNDANIIVAGGQESMSQSPHCSHLRNGTKMGDNQMVDSMIKDGLWDAFNGYHMGTTAENVAQQWQITRDQQDEFAVESQKRASKAKSDGIFKDEIVGVEIKSRKETVKRREANNIYLSTEVDPKLFASEYEVQFAWPETGKEPVTFEVDKPKPLVSKSKQLLKLLGALHPPYALDDDAPGPVKTGRKSYHLSLDEPLNLFKERDDIEDIATEPVEA